MYLKLIIKYEVIQIQFIKLNTILFIYYNDSKNVFVLISCISRLG